MSFFDQKQEVLDVTMTTYGRYLYSLGRFMPEYYAFFDDDIIYDSSHCFPPEHSNETQNEIEDRILYNTPRLKPLTNFSGVETGIKKQIKLVKSQGGNQRAGHELISGTYRNPADVNFQHELERDYTFGMPLGKTSYTNDDPPAFRVIMLAGEIEESSSVFVDPNIGGALRIPQIDIEINYDITAHNFENESKNLLTQQAKELNHDVSFSPTFEDGSYLKVEGRHVMIMLEEDNVEVSLEQFDVEVLEEVIEEKRIPKRDENGNVFVEKRKTVSYLPIFFDSFDNSVHAIHGFGIDQTRGTVSHYFDLNLDDELSVPTSVLESSIVDKAAINDALQKNSTMLLSKPLISSSFTLAGDGGMLSQFESDIYYTGISLGDPEECE